MARQVENVDIIVTATAQKFDQLKQQIEEVRASAQEAIGAMDKQGGGLTWTELSSKISIARQAVGMFIDASKELYQVGLEGAYLEFAEGKFNSLTTAIGTTSDAMMTDLRNATRGMMSDAEMMASAGDLMSLGLTNTHEQTVRLTSAAAALNMNMNQLVLTLTNQTTMRFDQLGVKVAGFDEKLAKLKSTGMDANAAFTEAFLQQAEEQIATVGNAADTSVGSFKRLESVIKDISDEAKQNMTPVLADAAGALADFLGASIEVRRGNEELYKSALETTDTYEDFIRVMQNGMVVASGYTEVIDGQLRVFRYMPDGIQDVTEEYDNLTRAMWEAAKAAPDMAELLRNARPPETTPTGTGTGATVQTDLAGAEAFAMSFDLGERYEDYTNTLIGLQDVHAGLVEDLDKVNVGSWKAAEKIGELNKKIKENEEAQDKAREAMNKYTSESLYKYASAGVNAEADLEVARALGLMDEEAYATAKTIDGLTQQYNAGILTAPEYANKIAMLQLAVDKLKSKDVTVTVTTIYREMKESPQSKLHASGYYNPASVEQGYANGADFIIPSGYPNDTYPMGYVSSGERVTVTPAGQQNKNELLLTEVIDALRSMPSARENANAMVVALQRAGVVG